MSRNLMIFDTYLRKIDSSSNVLSANIQSIKYSSNPSVYSIFNNIQALKMDLSQNLFFINWNPFIIGKIDISNNISNIYNQPDAGYQDGPISTALFNNPRNLIVDSIGNIYLADGDNHIIRKIDISGNVTTIAGTVSSAGFQDGPFGSNYFNLPTDITIDSSNNKGSIKIFNTYALDFVLYFRNS